MITVQGLQIDFDITSPGDIQRLNAAQEVAAEKEKNITAPTDTDSPTYLQAYASWLNQLLNIFGNFIDDAFGDGIAEQLLTNNPSITKMLDVNDALENALGEHAKQFAARFNKYAPNRATRRSK